MRRAPSQIIIALWHACSHDFATCSRQKVAGFCVMVLGIKDSQGRMQDFAKGGALIDNY